MLGSGDPQKAQSLVYLNEDYWKTDFIFPLTDQKIEYHYILRDESGKEILESLGNERAEIFCFHFGVEENLAIHCPEVDRPIAALLTDLEQRGLLEETLIVWGGEFGRTAYCQGRMTADNYGRDHHPRCFSMWMAGGGVKPGIVYGHTDDYSYNIVDKDGAIINPSVDTFTPGAVHIHDLNATILNQLGVDHTKLTYRYQGRDFRLTDVHGHVVKDIIA